MLDQVIPDTGADASALPWADCQQLQLDPTSGVPGLIGGVAGSSAGTLVFAAWATLTRKLLGRRGGSDDPDRGSRNRRDWGCALAGGGPSPRRSPSSGNRP